jgi:TonB family protein
LKHAKHAVFLFWLLALGAGCADEMPNTPEAPSRNYSIKPVPGQSYHRQPVPTLVVMPTYPEFAKDAGITGTVVVQALVGEDGLVHDGKVVQGVTGLNDSAVHAIAQWTFWPAMYYGRPAALWLEIAITFQLGSTGP